MSASWKVCIILTNLHRSPAGTYSNYLYFTGLKQLLEDENEVLPSKSKFEKCKRMTNVTYCDV